MAASAPPCVGRLHGVLAVLPSAQIASVAHARLDQSFPRSMLRQLGIRDFVIVDRLDLEFDSGFTVLTGETGAGKSILIDALSLVLGERSDAELVRHGCARAEISAEFDTRALPDVARWLETNDLAGEP